MAENAEVEEFTAAAPTPPPAPARVTKTWLEPAPQPVSTPKPSPAPSIGRQKKVDANQIIDELLDDPDNHKMRFRVGRDVGQVNWTGERIPAGTCGTLPIIPYNHLLEEIKQNWGAGHYSIQVIDAGGLQIVHYSRMVVEIPGKYAQKDATDVAPPTFHQPQTQSTAIVSTRKHEDEDSETAELLREEKRMQIQARIDQKRDEQEEREEKRAARRRAARKEELELVRLEQEMKGGAAPKEDSRLLAVIEEQKNTIAQLRSSYEEDRRRFQDSLTQMQNNIMLAAKSEGGGMKEILMMMQTQSIEMLKALSPALNRPPDNAALEVMQRASDMLIKATTRENSMERNLLNTLMTNMLNNKSNSIKDQMELVNMGREQLRESMEMAQAFGANLVSRSGGGEDEGDGYDPGAGFLGNIGRGLFGLIKEISKQAASNPTFGQLLMNMFGNKHPSDEQIRRHARQLEMSGQQLPMMPMHQQPQMQPQVQVQQPNPMFRSPNFSSPNQQAQQQAVPAPVAVQQPMAPMQSPNQSQQPAPAAPTVQTQPVQSPAPAAPQNAADQNLDLELELEGESSGIAAESASVTASYSAQVEQTTISGGSEEEMATPEARLRKFVTDSMEICLEDIVDKRNTRSWHDDAFDNWNGDFLNILAAMPSNDERAQAIATLTAAPVWEKLYDHLAKGGEELVQFHRNIDLLIEKVRAKNKPATAAQAPAMAQQG